RDLHIDNRSLAGNLTGIISQRLLRRLCPHCRRETPIDAAGAELFTHEELEPPEKVFAAKGCAECRHVGYFERIGIFEVVRPDRLIREAIERGSSEDELRSLIRSRGTPSLQSDALAKVRDGVTSLDELQAVTWRKLPWEG
ncbi:MAG: hypothetical protein WD063_05585, partial [Pirellulales bacterium]